MKRCVNRFNSQHRNATLRLRAIVGHYRRSDWSQACQVLGFKPQVIVLNIFWIRRYICTNLSSIVQPLYNEACTKAVFSQQPNPAEEALGCFSTAEDEPCCRRSHARNESRCMQMTCAVVVSPQCTD